VRNQPGDTERAVRALDTVLRYQFDEPGQPYHGTFYRAPEEAHPPTPATEWRHFDPNWREFVFTTIALILMEYERGLPAALIQKIDTALAKAVVGTLARRVRASYTNISLMNAFMLWFAGQRLGRQDWIEQGEVMAEEIYRLFKLHNAFEEYNSPTYYGVDIFALALWRAYAGSPVLCTLGAEMEAALWTDIAQYYHPGLRNIAGPYDRAYGMDMRRYAAVVGEWIYLVTGREAAPFPDLAGRFAHAHDVCFAPLAAVLGANVSASVRQRFLTFQGDLLIAHPISDAPRRVATAWLGENIMIGAQDTSRSKKGHPQFHPATVHWRIGDDEVGWIRLMHFEPLDAHASRNRLEIRGVGALTFQICAPGLAADMVKPALWALPNLVVHVETSLPVQRIQMLDDVIEICYAADAGQECTWALRTEQ
jgi:hypothetical protein